MSSPDSCNEEGEPPGDCFLAAFNVLFDMMGDPEFGQLLLVHGNVAHLPQDVDVNHAWVENASTVFDHSNGYRTHMAKDTYHSKLQITATRYYTPMESMRMNTDYGHYGPWPQ